MQIGGSQGTIGGAGVLANTFGGVGYINPVNASPIYASADLVVYEPSGALTIQNNTVNGTGNAGALTEGIDLSDVAPGVAVTISGNQLGTSGHGLDYGIYAYTYDDAKGLNSNPLISGNTFDINANGQGIFLDPESGVFTTNTAFTQTGSTADDYLHGSLGNDSLSGDLGADTLVWNANDGVDVLAGGGDTDTLDVAARGHNLTLTAGVGNFTVSEDGLSATQHATVSEVEEVDITLSGGETITINGDFTGTGIAQHTITIDGSVWRIQTPPKSCRSIAYLVGRRITNANAPSFTTSETILAAEASSRSVALGLKNSL